MNQRKIKEKDLWNLIEKSLKNIESVYMDAVRSRNPADFSPIIKNFRIIHWSSAFLGIKSLAELSAGAAVFTEQITEKKTWSPELVKALGSILRKVLEFIKAGRKEPSAGVFINASNTVIPEAELEYPVNINNIKEIFSKRLIDTGRVSACKPISVDKDTAFSHAVRIPSYAKKKHKNNFYLTLIYVNLDTQNESLEEIINKFETIFSNGNILLHGRLGLPWKKYRSTERSRPYYFLTDTQEDPEKWLKKNRLKGRIIKILKTPESSQSEQGVIIKEIITSSNSAVPAVSAVNRSTSITGNLFDDWKSLISFDSPFASELEPVTDDYAIKKTRKKRKKISNRDLNIKFPVGAKLILIVSLIIITAMSTLTYISLLFFQKETENRVKDTNISLSRTVARQAEKEIIQLFDSANLLFQVSSASEDPQSLVNDFFTNYPSLIYVGIPGSKLFYINKTWFRENRVLNEKQVIERILSTKNKVLDKARNGDTVITNISPLIPNLQSPVIALAAPFLLGTSREELVVFADVGDSLGESVRNQEGLTTTVIVNSDGEILAHPDYTKVFGGENIKDSQIFKTMYTQGINEGQIVFDEEQDGKIEKIMGSYALIPVGNLGVVTTVLVTDAFKVVEYIKKLNLYLLGAILSVTILGIFFFSQSISIPLKELTLATRQIKAGNYNIHIVPKTSDEVGLLTRNFMSMIPELEKVDRLQERTSKFVNPQVARMIAEDSLPEHAETKDVTVFFSDVRSFTAMSEAMGDPQLVLDNLSEYFQTMVPCVEETLGTVDKFIGDAIMAVWGSMKDLPNHAENAINGALLMRKALIEFNLSRGTPLRPKFKIGCGLNSGPATVGLMGGGSSKEEWAHMGDTVNLASRVEALNKPMGTDILITDNTYKRVMDIFEVVPMKKIKVKGKSEPQQIYAVLGRKDDPERPETLEELRIMLGITGDFNTNKDVDEHEVKYEILDS